MVSYREIRIQNGGRVVVVSRSSSVKWNEKVVKDIRITLKFGLTKLCSSWDYCVYFLIDNVAYLTYFEHESVFNTGYNKKISKRP